jgi:hypothetical protein
VIGKEIWGPVRTILDAWVVSGRVLDHETGAPVEGATVLAYDKDLLDDDTLGGGVTDADGNFRIDFTSSDFRAKAGNLERAGPDLYFYVKSSDGKTLLAEAREAANRQSRRDVPNLHRTELVVDSTGRTYQEALEAEREHARQVEMVRSIGFMP